MSQRQLAAVELDYQGYVPLHWHVITCESRYTTGVEDRAHIRCAVCNCRFGPAEQLKEITWELRRELNSYLGLRTVKAVVCRNGVACRRRATASSAPPAAAA
jgi:hypothetical protein